MPEKRLGEIRQVLIQSGNIHIKQKDEEKIINKLNKYFHNVIWDKKCQYVDSFTCFQNFLFNDNKDPNDLIQLKLGDFKFHLEYHTGEKEPAVYKKNNRIYTPNDTYSNKSSTYDVEVFAFIYPKFDIVNILYCIPIKDISIDEFIYIRKVIQFDKQIITIEETNLLKNYTKNCTFNDITMEIYRDLIAISGYKKYIIRYIIANIIKLNFQLSKTNYIDHTLQVLNTHKMMMVEIRAIIGIDKLNLFEDGFVDKYARPLYGLLVCDEGFRFVPKMCALKALEKSFSSREYSRTFTSNIGVLEINLLETNLHNRYKTSQGRIAKRYGDKDTEKTSRATNYAGLEHGSLIAMERAAMLHVIIDSNMKKDYYNLKKSVRKIIKNRRKMIEIISLVMTINISEMAKLTDIIMDKLGIYKYVERVRERLDMAENDTLIIYQKKNNRLMFLLTLFGLFIAAMSVEEIKTKLLELIDKILICIIN